MGLNEHCGGLGRKEKSERGKGNSSGYGERNPKKNNASQK